MPEDADAAWEAEKLRAMTPSPQVTGFTARNGVNEDGRIVQIASGEYHTFALSATGKLFVFGGRRDTAGRQISFNPEAEQVDEHHPIPFHIPLDKKVKSMVMGQNYAWVKFEGESSYSSFGMLR